MTRRPVPFAAALAIAAACLGCSPTVSPTPSGSSISPAPTAPASPVGPTAIFDQVSPSVVFVATAVGAGSGFVLDARHVVTNAHVVRPFAQARLVLPDGRSIERAVVVGWDLIADLALLEVPDAIGAAPLSASDARGHAIGDRVYLVGYPQADLAAPRATISEGIIAGPDVEWLDELTYLETDAAIDDGQSGGVLVDRDARFLGVTGGSRGRFAVALDAADALTRAAGLAAGEDVDGLPDGVLPAAGANAPLDVEATIRNRADEHVWIMSARQGQASATVKLTADEPVGLFGLAAAGLLGHGIGPPAKTSTLTVDFEPPGPYLVKVQSVGHAAVRAKLHSTVGLTAVADAEHGDPLTLDVPRSGRTDYAGDIDWFTLRLDKGQRVTVRVSGAGFDPQLFLDATGTTDQTLATGHDAGGPLGMDDELSYTARESATYRIVVADGRFLGSGGYRVLVTSPSATASPANP